MLDGTGNPAGDIELRRNGLAGGADLAAMLSPFGIDDRPAGAVFSLEGLGQWSGT
jgi:hypothetical protein